MKTIFNSKIVNSYQSHTPKGFYDAKMGHTGEDYDFNHEELHSHISGTVLLNIFQPQMGNVMYLEDAQGAIHVFAHLTAFKVTKGSKVVRGDLIAISGNSGTSPTGHVYVPHLHYEILTKTPINAEDRIMDRPFLKFKGFNTAPLKYCLNLYAKYGVDPKTLQPIPVPAAPLPPERPLNHQ